MFVALSSVWPVPRLAAPVRSSPPVQPYAFNNVQFSPCSVQDPSPLCSVTIGPKGFFLWSRPWVLIITWLGPLDRSWFKFFLSKSLMSTQVPGSIGCVIWRLCKGRRHLLGNRWQSSNLLHACNSPLFHVILGLDRGWIEVFQNCQAGVLVNIETTLQCSCKLPSCGVGNRLPRLSALQPTRLTSKSFKSTCLVWKKASWRAVWGFCLWQQCMYFIWDVYSKWME